MNIVPEITRKSITHLINNQERVDGRALDEYREISLETGVISKAEGSARVKIGNTQIMVGTKPQIGEPFPDTPDVGVLMTNSELLPMASPSFEPGPPDERSVELSRVADRCIRESEMVDLKELCIIPGKKVWMVFIDLHILDYDGNLMDAAVLGAVAALKNTMIPEVKVVDNEIIIDHENMKPLPIREEVVMCTFAKIGEQLVIDPSLDEEEILSARLSIGITASDKICAMQKGGDSPLTKEEIMNAVKITEGKSKELMKYLE